MADTHDGDVELQVITDKTDRGVGDRRPLAATELSPAQDQSINLFMLLVISLSATSGFLFGYDLCVITVALEPVSQAFQLELPQTEGVVSIVMLGATLGSLFSGGLADKFGRRAIILACCVLFGGGGGLLAAAWDYPTLMVGRVIVGFAIGASATAVPVNLAELSKPAVRGMVVAATEVALCFGCLCSLALGVAVMSVPDNWRIMFAGALVPAVFQFIGVAAFLPPSPRWLVLNGRHEQALQVLKRIHGEQLAAERLAELQEALTAHDDSLAHSDGTVSPFHHANVSIIGRLRLMWQTRPERAAVLLAASVAIAQNFTASNSIMYFSGVIFKQAGAPAAASTLGVGFTKFAGVLFAMFLVKRFGRRQILIVGTFVEAVSLAVLCIAFWTLPRAILTPVATTGVLVFIAAWNSSWAPLMFVVCSELLPSKCRGLGMGIAIACYWVTSFVTNQLLLSIAAWLSFGGAFCLLTCTTLCALMFVYFRLPETKGKSLEQIEAMFAGTGPAIYHKQVTTDHVTAPLRSNPAQSHVDLTHT